MTFGENLTAKVSVIEEKIRTYLPACEGYQKVIMEAMEYSLLAGGKRLRPLFMGEMYEMFGGENPAELEPFQAAMEMIHTYSLVHDDLPAMDNDDYRRGRKTTHVVYGEAMGILAGDALLNYAFETACKAFERTDAAKVGAALSVLAKKAGIYGMIGGQVVDVQSEGQQIEREKLEFIYETKTGALIESSMMIGAIMAGAGAEDVSRVEQIGRMVGMAFQIQDDILDVTGSQEELGKPVHSDEKNEKCTYVTLVGLERAAELVKEYSDGALELLAELEEKKQKNEFLEKLIRVLITRRK